MLTQCLHKLNQLEDDMLKRQTLIKAWEPWGDFDPQDIQALRSQGCCVKLYKIPVSELGSLPEDIVCQKIFVHEKIAHCVVIGQEGCSLSFPEIALPAMGLDQMKALQEADARKILVIKEELKKDGIYLNAFKESLGAKTSDLRLQEALAGMGQNQGLFYLKGFCPSENFVKLQGLARRQKWGLVMEEPDDEDKVPTLMKNPKWVELIKPIFAFLDILPGYRELDISIPFLLFFSLFFGILVGDAGYGFLIFLVAVFLHMRQKKLSNKNVIFLIYLSSLCAIIWGLLTGVVFGQGWTTAIKPLLPWINEPKNMQVFCFSVGVMHLTLAHVWRIIIKMPALTAWAEAGWLMILWAMFFLAKNLVLSIPLPFFFKGLLGAGIFLAVFFHQPSPNIFKSIGAGLGNLLLSIANMFGDIMSYLRLFAVGLASVAVADFFNQIVAGIGFKTVFSSIGVVLLLVVGHGLNLILGLLAVLVHGIRLNILEFSSHMGIEWSGVEYTPFCQMKHQKS
jgi:V/A-type H+-transporting ATPase subunit I